jgi:plasmid stabilization system protein ParE
MTTSRVRALRWTARAERDVEEQAARIGADDARAARRWLERVIRHVEKTSTIPLAGRVVPELGRDDIRETSLGRYRIAYRVDPIEIALLAVFASERSGWPDEADPDAT